MANVKVGEKCAVTSHNTEIKGGQMPLSGQHLKKRAVLSSLHEGW